MMEPATTASKKDSNEQEPYFFVWCNLVKLAEWCLRWCLIVVFASPPSPSPVSNVRLLSFASVSYLIFVLVIVNFFDRSVNHILQTVTYLTHTHVFMGKSMHSDDGDFPVPPPRRFNWTSRLPCVLYLFVEAMDISTSWARQSFTLLAWKLIVALPLLYLYLYLFVEAMSWAIIHLLAWKLIAAFASFSTDFNLQPTCCLLSSLLSESWSWYWWWWWWL